jgi:hypothetical protein
MQPDTLKPVPSGVPSAQEALPSESGAFPIARARRLITEVFRPEELRCVADPCINIIIPTHKSTTVDTVIARIGEEPFPENTRVRLVVCANGARDGTAALASYALVAFHSKVPNSTFISVGTEVAGEPQALNQMVALIRDGARTDHSDNIVIGINDDVLPTPGSICALYLAMLANPDLGSIGVVPKPIGYEARLVSRIAAATQAGIGEDIIWGKMYAFRPSVIGDFPEDLIAEDLFMLHQSIVRSEGFGIIQDGQSFVHYTLPTNLRDVWRESLLHWRAASQFNRRYPEIGIFSASKSSRRRIRRQSEFGLAIRLLGALVSRNARLFISVSENLRPTGTAIRDRIPTKSL